MALSQNVQKIEFLDSPLSEKIKIIQRRSIRETNVPTDETVGNAGSTFRPWDNNKDEAELTASDLAMMSKIEDHKIEDGESMNSLASVGLGLGIKVPKYLTRSRLASAGYGGRQAFQAKNKRPSEIKSNRLESARISSYYSHGLRKLSRKSTRNS